MGVLIVSPSRPGDNNGNGQTAQRYAEMLRGLYAVEVVQRWAPPAAAAVMIALHARRSADSIQAWAAHHRARSSAPKPDTCGLAVVLTGTDLYRDLQSPDEQVRHQVLNSLEAADQLVLLQDQAIHALPPHLRSKARVIYQSTTQAPLPKASIRSDALQALMVGHLREEKDPATLMRAAALLTPDDGIHIDHIGGALDDKLAHAAQAAQAQSPHYRWLGAMPHEATRQAIARADVLVHTSRLEGGAHVIMEAVCSSTPVLATRMVGNIGMLGTDYQGYFEVGDEHGLVQLLRRLRHDRAFGQTLQAQCAARVPLFAPEREQALLRAMVAELLLPGARR